MNKKKKIVIVLIVLLILLFALLGGSTYAKYKSKVTGNANADVSNWNFLVNNNKEIMQTISLNSTINNSTLVGNKIAPGTSGSFQIKLDATNSETGVNYIVNFENETQKPRNLKFTYNNKTYNTLADLEKDLIGTIGVNDSNKVKELNIGWNWKYETGNTPQEIAKNDEIDTEDGKNLNNYTFSMVVTGTQVKPAN